MPVSSDPSAKWIFRPRPNPYAELRLVCFPWAGGSASVFRTWPDELPPEVEVLAIAMPGRDARVREPMFDRVTPMVTSLTDAIGHLLDPPFAIYGHSYGAMLGFGFAQELVRRSLGQPVHFFASARRAPQLADPSPLRELPDAEFLDELYRIGGIPDAVFHSPELMKYLLPILRTDIAASESETFGLDEPLGCPITVMGGLDDDRVSVDDLDAWQLQTTGPFGREMYPGGHFFIKSERERFLSSLFQQLSHRIAEAS
jgi:medium-chain acyl-[acyl-carrier-protein] hydrolase